MSEHRWHWLPIGLVATGVIAVLVATIANAATLGWWQAPIYGGCAAAAAAAFLFRRKLSVREVELEANGRRMDGEATRLANDRSQFEELRLAVQQELEEGAGRLNKREQALADRLVTYHEWMEFPQPQDLSHPSLDDNQLKELARKDREMLALLKAETKALYDRILQNKYAPQGSVLLPVIRDDIVSLVTRVARIYQPSAEQPLLEASLTRVFRAISRASLQMLVVLDELPVDVKHASLNTLYNYVRSAVSTWRMYKSAEPYWPYVNTAYYLGRFALGANPLALGAWWFVGNLGSRGAQAIAQHVINRQALAVLSGLVRVIGYEVAGIYGSNFRHRDANWIYAAELTELISDFPLSRDSLAHALREIGALELRSEYDRIFLYRCLASGKSARPERYAATTVLTMDERRAVATRLERFMEAFVHGKTAQRVGKWKSGAEERLGVKLSIALKSSAADVQHQIADALRSLASFLVAIKQLEPREAAADLKQCLLLKELPDNERAALLEKLSENASFFFEHPDLDPDGDLPDKYLEDLAALNARVAPHPADIEATLDDVAAYLRRSPKKMHSLVEKHNASALASRLPPDTPQRRFPPPAVRAALDLIADPQTRLRFLYGPARLEWTEGVRPEVMGKDSLWLLGLDRQVLLYSSGAQPRVLWKSTADRLTIEPVRQLLTTSCRLTGGEWQASAGSQPVAIRLPAGLGSNFSSYFRPLLEGVGTGAPAERADVSTSRDGTRSVPST